MLDLSSSCSECVSVHALYVYSKLAPSSIIVIEKYHVALPVHVPLSASFTFKKVAHEKVRDTSRERERVRGRERGEGG